MSAQQISLLIGWQKWKRNEWRYYAMVRKLYNQILIWIHWNVFFSFSLEPHTYKYINILSHTCLQAHIYIFLHRNARIRLLVFKHNLNFNNTVKWLPDLIRYSVRHRFYTDVVYLLHYINDRGWVTKRSLFLIYIYRSAFLTLRLKVVFF